VRRKYDKPVFAVEEYALTQNIASCVTKIGLANSECVINDPDSTDHMRDLAYSGFFAGDMVCVLYAEGMDSKDSICYHTNANAAFNS